MTKKLLTLTLGLSGTALAAALVAAAVAGFVARAGHRLGVVRRQHGDAADYAESV
eukprot:gene8140-10356_t